MRVNRPFNKEIAYGVIKTLQALNVNYNTPVRILGYYIERIPDGTSEKPYEGGSIYRFTPDRFKAYVDPQVYEYRGMTESWID